MKYNKNDNNDNKNKTTTTTTLLLYRCVYCGTPCHSLYRQLSSSSHSIKLTTCIACNQVVDPYIEREILLIVIDCILLREEAYRHVLYNRLLLMLMMNGKNNNEATAAAVDNNNTMDIFSSSSSFNSVVFTWKRALQVLLSWCILDTYLIWETLKISQRLALATEDYSSSSPTTSITNTDVEDVVDVTDNNNNIILPELYHITFIAMISLSGIVLQWMTIYWYLQQRQQRQRQQYQRRQQQSQQQQQQHYDNNKNNNIFNYHLVLLKIQIYLALIVPSSFAHVVTILVLIWENTTTIVHLLGYILIASWQCLALSVLSYNNNNNSSTYSSYSSYPSVDNPLQEDETSKSQKIIDNTTDNKEKRKTTTATTTKITTTTFTLRPFLVGLFVRILWKLVCSYFLPKLLMLVVGTGTTTTTTTTTASSYHETLNFQLPCVGSLDIRFPLSLGSFVHYLRGDTYEFESSIVSICLT